MAERFGLHIDDFLIKFSSIDIAELMAFDNLQDKDYRERINSEMMTDEEQEFALMEIFRGN